MKKSLLLTYTALSLSTFTLAQNPSMTNQLPLLQANPSLESEKKLEKIVITESFMFLSSKEKLPVSINTSFTETKPILSFDGKTMYFCRQASPQNMKGRKDPGDIYITEYINGKWTTPKNVAEPLNNRYANGACALSPDGRTIYLLDAYTSNNQLAVGLASAQKTDAGWTYPSKLQINEHYNHNEYIDYFIAPSGKVMILAVEREDSNGNQDLYVSLLQEDGNWSTPENMGQRINSGKAEFAPFISADEKTLYFASYGHPGFGESDIFMSHRLDDSWTNWSTVKNLGQEINSQDWEGYYYQVEGSDEALFVSNSGNRNKTKDIYKINLKNIEDKSGVRALNGKIKDAKNQRPIQAYLEIWPVDKKHEVLIKKNTDKNSGNFQFIVEEGETYQFTASATGYMETSGTLKIRNDKKLINQDIFLTPLQLNNVYKLQKTNLNSKLLSDENLAELKVLVRQLHANPNLSIEIQNLTFKTKDPSPRSHEERLEAVRSFLVQEGIEEERILLKAYEENKLAESISPFSEKGFSIKLIQN